MPIEAGSVLNGRYSLRKVLGQGGMGTVFLAEDRKHRRRQVALKLLRADVLIPEAIGYFKREFEILAEIHHPHIAEVLEFSSLENEAGFFYTSTYIRGHDVLRASRMLDLKGRLDLAIQMCRALHFIHGRGIVHRDIKPTNFLIESDSARARLLDFGIAQVLGSSVEDQKICGTPTYLAPEIIRGERFDHRADLYAFGLLLWRMFFESSPFADLSDEEIYRLHLEGLHLPPVAFEKSFPEPLRLLITRLTDRYPQGRPAYTGSVLEELGEIAGVSLPRETEATALAHIASSGIVGRDVVLHNLYEAIHSSDRSCAFLISGEVGIGKSFLLEHIQRKLLLEGANVISANTLQDLIEQILPRLNSDREYRQFLEEFIAPQKKVSAAIPAVSDVLLFYDRLAKALIKISQAQPLILVSADYDAEDSVLMGFYHHLLRRMQGASEKLAVCLAWTGPDAGPFAPLVQKKFLQHYPLTSFLKDQVGEMLARMLPGKKPDDDFIERILGYSNGNPLAIKSILESLVRLKKIYFRGFEWHFRSFDERDLRPARNLSALLVQRLESLETDYTRVLNLLAVYDEWLPYDHACEIMMRLPEGKALDLHALLKDLSAMELVSHDAQQRYRITQRLLRSLIYERITAKHKMEIHREIVGLLERKKCPPAFLAHHLLQSGFEEKSAPVWQDAGEQASQRYAHQEAIHCYEQAVRYFPQNRPERIELYHALGDIHRVSGQFQLAANSYRNALDAGEKNIASLKQAVLYRLLGNSLRLSGQIKEAEQTFREGLERSHSLDAPVEEALLMVQMGLLCHMRGEKKAALEFCKKALQKISQSEDKKDRAYIASIYAKVLEENGSLSEALHEYELSLSTYQDARDLTGQVMAQNNLGLFHLKCGRPKTAIKMFREALPLAEKTGDLPRVIRLSLNMANAFALTGRLDRAQRLCHFVKSEAAALGLEDLRFAGLQLLGGVLFDLGECKQGYDTLKRVLFHNEKLNQTVLQAQTHLLLGHYLADLGLLGEAKESLLALQPLLKEKASPPFLAQWSLLEMKICALTGENERARNASQKAKEILGRLQLQHALATLFLEECELAMKPLPTEELNQIVASGYLQELHDSQLRAALLNLHANEDAIKITKHLETIQNPLLGCWTSLALAKFYLAQGERDRAQDHYESASVALQSLSALFPDEWREALLTRSRYAVMLEEMKVLRKAKQEDSQVHASGFKQMRELLDQGLEEISLGRQSRRVFNFLLDGILRITGAERAFMVSYPEGKIHVVALRTLDKESLKDPEKQLSHSLVARVFQTGKPIFSFHVKGDREILKHQTLESLNVRSVAALPLGTSEEKIGLLYLDQQGSPVGLNAQDLEVLKPLLPLLSLLLDKVLLQEELIQVKDKLNKQISERTQELSDSLETIRRLQDELGLQHSFAGIVGGRSPRMKQLFQIIAKVAPTRSNVLIEGESGTGKELIAQAIHNQGMPAGVPFVAVNCGALSPQLLESELFGYMRGSFTGANQDKPGLFEAADQGTLFLDEIGDMPLDMQVKILRAVQNGEITRMGDTQSRQVQVRLVAATNKSLEAEVKAGRFREDLFYRLNVIYLKVPALRERIEDLSLLIKHFLDRFSNKSGVPRPKISTGFMRFMERYTWPGNIRQLENVLHSILVLQKPKMLGPEHLPQEIQDSARGFSRKIVSLALARENFQEEYLRKALLACEGKVSKVAKLAGVKRQYIYALMKKYKIEISSAAHDE